MDRLHDRDPSEVGPYELLGVLGHGGMGRVFLGRDGAGQLAAVKVVSEDLAGDAGFRKRFAREVAATRAVQDRYVAAILDADVEARQPWLATEYIDGPSLHEVVQDRGRMPADEVRALAVRLAEALAAIHAAGLVHRDVKPANILIAADGARLIDFGIARDAAVSTITRTGTVLGTPAYMAPERFQGKAGSHAASDVFSLGGVLAYALTGHHPFGEEEPGALAYRIVHEPAQLDGIEHPDLRDLVARCLAKDPGSRPTAADIETELRTGVRATNSAGADKAVPGDRAEASSDSGAGAVEAAGLVKPEPIETVVLRPGRWRRPALVGGTSLAVVVALAAVLAEGGGSHADAGNRTGTFPGPASGSTSTSSTSSASSALAAATAASSSVSASAPSSPAAKPNPPSSSQSSVSQRSASPDSTQPAASQQQSSTAAHTTARPTTAPKPSTPHTSAAPPTTKPPTSKPPAGAPPAQMAGFDVAESACVGVCHVSITLTWSAQSDATGYEVRFVDSTAGVDQTDPAGGTSYVVYATTDDSVCLSMAATNQYGASAWKGPYCFTA